MQRVLVLLAFVLLFSGEALDDVAGRPDSGTAERQGRTDAAGRADSGAGRAGSGRGEQQAEGRTDGAGRAVSGTGRADSGRGEQQAEVAATRGAQQAEAASPGPSEAPLASPGAGTKAGLPVRRLSAADKWLATAMHYHKGREYETYFLYVGFQSGGVAKIFLNTGEVLWAHEPTAGSSGIKSLLYKPLPDSWGVAGVVVVVTDSGKVQAWDSEDGHLKWERSCPGAVAGTVVSVGGADDGVALACASEVEVRSLRGKVSWGAAAPVGFVFKASDMADSGHNFCTLALSSTRGALSTKYDSYTGNVMSQREAPEAVAQALAGNAFIKTGAYLIWATPGKVHNFFMCGDEDVHSADALGAQPTALLEAVQDTPGVFTMTGTAATSVFRSTHKELALVFQANGRALAGPVHGATYAETGKWVAVASAYDEQAGCRVRVVHIGHGGDGGCVAEPGAYSVAKYGKVARILVQELLERRGGGFRAFIATGFPDALVAVQGGGLHWARNGFGADSVLVQSNTTTTTSRRTNEL